VAFVLDDGRAALLIEFYGVAAADDTELGPGHIDGAEAIRS